MENVTDIVERVEAVPLHDMSMDQWCAPDFAHALEGDSPTHPEIRGASSGVFSSRGLKVY